MRKNIASSVLAAAGLLIFPGTDGLAATLTLDPTSISFSPSNVVSNNTITAQQVAPDLVKLFGDATITQPASTVSTVTLSIGGTYNTDPVTPDLFSVSYDFTLTLASAAPVAFTLQGSIEPTTFPFFPPITIASGTVTQGSNTYTGTFSAPVPLAGPGTWSGQLVLTFSAPATGDTLTLSIPNNSIDFQLGPTAIPEPSSISLIALGAAALLLLARRSLAA